MKASIKPIHVLIASAIILVVGGLGFGTYWTVYQMQSEHPAVLTVASIFQLPAARVGDESVTYGEYQAHLSAQRVFLQGPTAQAQGLTREIGTEDRVQAYERAIRIAAVADMAAEEGVQVTALDVDRAYQGLIQRAGTSTNVGEIQQFLKDEFGWNEDQFKQYVVRPAILEDTLKQQWFTETQDATAFDTRLSEKLNSEETKRYLSFE